MNNQRVRVMRASMGFAAALAFVLAAAEQGRIAQLDGENVRYRSFIGGQSAAEFEHFATDLLAARTITVGMVTCFASRYDYALGGPRAVSACNYESWRAGAGNAVSPTVRCPEMREAIKLGDRIVIRSTDRGCRVLSSVVGNGNNPLEFSIADQRFQILDLSFSRPSGVKNQSRIAVNFYVRADDVAALAAAREVTSRLQSLSKAEYLTVRLRSDAWFLADCGFPTIFGFNGPPEFPTAEQFRTTQYATCTAAGAWPIQCFQAYSDPLRRKQ